MITSEKIRIRQEIQQRVENLARYKALVRDADEPRVEACRREFERAKRALEEAERCLKSSRAGGSFEKEKLDAAYADFYRESTR